MNRGQCLVPLRHQMLSGFQSTGAGKTTLMSEAADFTAWFVTAPGLVVMQKPFCPLCNLLPSPFCFLADCFMWEKTRDVLGWAYQHSSPRVSLICCFSIPWILSFLGRAVSTSMSSLPLGTGTEMVVVILAIGWVTFCFKAVNV